ncbi:MAG: hypothetical protein ACREJF_02895 [Candidatus Methylomirabilales bacterium]
MRPTLLVCGLFLAAFFFAPAAFAQEEKKAKKVKSQGTYQIDWGRRKDITLRYWPLHQHPYVRIQ